MPRRIFLDLHTEKKPFDVSRMKKTRAFVERYGWKYRSMNECENRGYSKFSVVNLKLSPGRQEMAQWLDRFEKGWRFHLPSRGEKCVAEIRGWRDFVLEVDPNFLTSIKSIYYYFLFGGWESVFRYLFKYLELEISSRILSIFSFFSRKKKIDGQCWREREILEMMFVRNREQSLIACCCDSHCSPLIRCNRGESIGWIQSNLTLDYILSVILIIHEFPPFSWEKNLSKSGTRMKRDLIYNKWNNTVSPQSGESDWSFFSFTRCVQYFLDTDGLLLVETLHRFCFFFLSS